MVTSRFSRRLAAGVLLFLMPAAAFAQGALINLPDQIVSQFAGPAAGWVPIMTGYARTVFYSLTLITFAWKMSEAIFTRAAKEHVVAELVETIMFIGVGIFFLDQGPAILNAIIDSLRRAGAVAGQVGIAPSDILNAGFQTVDHVWSHMSLWSPGATAGLVIVAVILLACVAWIAGMMTLALVEAALFVPFCMLFSGFLGSQWTRQIAQSVIMQAFAIGVKLMFMELMAGLSLGIIRDTITSLNDFTAPAAGKVIVAAIIVAMLISKIPDRFAAIFGGVSIGEASITARAALATATAALAATTAGVGGATALNSASNLANTQLAASEASAAPGSAPKAGFGRAASIAGSTLRNLGQAAAQDVGLRLTGQGGRHGSAPWRMAASMNQQRRLLSDDLNKPKP